MNRYDVTVDTISRAVTIVDKTTEDRIILVDVPDIGVEFDAGEQVELTLTLQNVAVSFEPLRTETEKA